MDIASLHQLYQAELQEARSFEVQIADAFGDLAGRASGDALRSFLADASAEARGHADRVSDLLERHGAARSEHEDQAMQGLLTEARAWADQIDDAAVRDAALIASAQRVQHYEIAVYGTLTSWAKVQKLDRDVSVLSAILDEEKEADEALSDLAETDINLAAA